MPLEKRPKLLFRDLDTSRSLTVSSLILTGCLIFLNCSPEVQPLQSFTVAKSSWPAWDAFKIGVQQRERNYSSISTTFLEQENYVLALDAFREETVDAATLTIYEAIQAASQGVSLKIVLLLDYTIGSDGVIAGNQIREILDLKGRRIGVERGTISHFTLMKTLEKAGLTQDDVEIVYLDLAGLQQAFLSGSVEAIAIYEPYMTDLLRKSEGHVLFSSREIPRSICDVLFVKEQIVCDHPDVIDHWIAAWDGVLRQRRTNTQWYFQALSQISGTAIPDLQRYSEGIFFTSLAENRTAFSTTDRPGYLLNSLREMEDFMYRFGAIQQRVEVDNLITAVGVLNFFRHKSSR